MSMMVMTTASHTYSDVAGWAMKTRVMTSTASRHRAIFFTPSSVMTMYVSHVRKSRVQGKASMGHESVSRRSCRMALTTLPVSSSSRLLWYVAIDLYLRGEARRVSWL